MFIAEAIISPSKIAKYFGEDAINAKECKIAYNATFMALLWDAFATKNANLLNRGVKSLPEKLKRATWLNYVRCHKETIPFADFDNRQLLTLKNPNLLAFSRTDPQSSRNKVLVIANFNVETQAPPINKLKESGFFITNKIKNLCTGTYLPAENDTLSIPPLSFYWLTE